MKRLLFVFFVLVIALPLSGCENSAWDGIKTGVNDFFNDSNEDDYVVVLDSEVEKKALQMGELVYNAVSSRDASALKNNVSSYTKSKYNIDNEIQALFDSIKGTPLSYVDICLIESDGNTSEENGDVYNSYSVKIDNIKTNQGFTYCIYVEGIYNYYYQPDKVGINEISLERADDNCYESDEVVIGNVIGYEFDDETDDDGEAKVMD